MIKEDRLKFIFILILIGYNLLVFLPSARGGFVLDDKFLIERNSDIQNPNFLKSFFFSAYGIEAGLDESSKILAKSMPFYRPFSALSLWMDYKVWGMNPSGFHITNIFIHLISVIIIYFILLNVNLNQLESFFCALVFSAFPLHFENVSWISARTDLLSFLFTSLSIFFFIKYYKTHKYLFIHISSFFYLFSLFSKENNIFLIGIFFLVLLKRRTKFSIFLHTFLPFVLSLMFWAILRHIALQSIIIELSGRNLMDFFAAIGFYFLKVLWPFYLSVTVNSFMVFNNPLYQFVGIGISFLFLFSIVYLFKRELRISNPLFILFSFYIMLIPSVLIIFSASTVSYIAWRFLYLPSILFTTYLVFIIFRRIKISWIPTSLLLVLTLLYSLEIYGKNCLFGKSEPDFWFNFKNIQQESMMVQFNVGVNYLRKDEKIGSDILNNILKQREHPFYNLYKRKVFEFFGTFYTFKGEFNRAERYFNILIESEKSHTLSFYFNYANFLALSGKSNQGERIILKQLKRYPQNHLVLLHSARFYLLIKKYQRAQELMERDYQLFPNEKIKKMLKTIENKIQH